jgi:phosphoglycolate phosphatase-like HAD superfamily hydrolase
MRLHGIAETPTSRERLIEGYLRRLPDYLHKHQGKVLPGIVPLLEHLAAQDRVAVGLLTGNLRAGARLKLGHFELFHHFAFGGFGDHHWERDDVAREAWAVIHERMNGAVPPDHVWVVGDTPLDVQCARAIGARVAAVATGWHSAAELAAARPDLLLTNLTDPAPLLSNWSL